MRGIRRNLARATAAGVLVLLLCATIRFRSGSSYEGFLPLRSLDSDLCSPRWIRQLLGCFAGADAVATTTKSSENDLSKKAEEQSHGDSLAPPPNASELQQSHRNLGKSIFDIVSIIGIPVGKGNSHPSGGKGKGKGYKKGKGKGYKRGKGKGKGKGGSRGPRPNFSFHGKGHGKGRYQYQKRYYVHKPRGKGRETEPSCEPQAMPSLQPPVGRPMMPPQGSPPTPPQNIPTRQPQAVPTSPPQSSPTSPPQSSPTSPPQSPPNSPPQSPPTSAPQSPPTSAPQSSPTSAPVANPPFECGGEPTTTSIDIVLVVDESRSMKPVQRAVQRSIVTLFQTIQSVTNGNFRMGLVGFTGPNSDFGPVTADPEMLLPLTNNEADFQAAADALVIAKVSQENGRGALLVVAENQVENAAEVVVPLAGDEEFPGELGFCAVLITDEINQDYRAFPDPGTDAVLAEYARTGSSIFVVGPNVENDYNLLSEGTGGTINTVAEFTADPDSLIAAIVQRCVTVQCSDDTLAQT